MGGAQDDGLLVIGAGGLGARTAIGWRERHAGARVVAETRSDRSHAQLRAAGLSPRLRVESHDGRFPNVLVSIPPSQQDDYQAECARAVDRWDGSAALLLVSSTAVYAGADGGRCLEDSPLADNERARRLLAAEDLARERGGVILRLAGLYDHERGPQRVFLRRDSLARRPDGVINLIHYEDAAALCVCALERGKAGATYLGCDDEPLTRQQLLEATVASGRYPGSDDVPIASFFTTADGPLGRRCDSHVTREALDWRPRQRSFVAWVTSGRA